MGLALREAIPLAVVKTQILEKMLVLLIFQILRMKWR
jgi:hypothetical protein